MIVVPEYRGHRIEVNAAAVDGRFNAEVRIRRLFSQDKAHVDTVTCLKMTPHLAEHSGEIICPSERSWERVDMSRGVLRLEVTKSGKRREVSMRQAVYDVSAALPEPHQGRVWRSGNIRTSFERAVAVAKLDTPFHFHDCRHHFASWFVMRGGNIVALQDLLGHASLSMTRRYSHLAPDHLRSEVAKTEKPRPAGVAIHPVHGTRASHGVESGTSSLVSA